MFTFKESSALFTDNCLNCAIAKGPITPAALQAVSNLPCIPPTCIVPNISAKYAGIVAKPPPYIVKIIIVAA